MVSSAHDEWLALGSHWHAAFDEAWESYRAGDMGIGAVLVDPDTDSVVSTGRNRVNGASPGPGILAGNFMAHAEMNALGSMTSFKADGLHLYTTLEPCLMCAATSIFLHVDTVHFAVRDEFFDGVGDLWKQHEYTSRYQPELTGPLTGKVAAFARVLPLSINAATYPNARAMFIAERDVPEIAALAKRIAANEFGTLNTRATTVASVFDELWAELPAAS